MDNCVTREDFERIEDLVKKATSSYSKKDATYYINQLESYSIRFSGYKRTVFSSLICSVKRASGRVNDKNRLMQYVNADLQKLMWEN